MFFFRIFVNCCKYCTSGISGKSQGVFEGEIQIPLRGVHRTKLITFEAPHRNCSDCHIIYKGVSLSICGALDGGPHVACQILRNANVPCHLNGHVTCRP